MVFNEQIPSSSGLSVNAVHMHLLGPIARGELIIGQSQCGGALDDGRLHHHDDGRPCKPGSGKVTRSTATAGLPATEKSR